MAVLSGLYTFNNGDVIDAPQMNTNFTQVKTFVDNLSAGSNFDAGAIGTATIADSAITSAKIASNAVTTGKIAASITLTTPILGAATATSIAVTNNVVYHVDTNATIGAYTLALTDDGKVVEMNNAAGTTLTIPLNSSVAFPVGTQIIIIQTGAGQTTIAGASGVTVNGTPGLKLRAQYSSCVCLKRATDTWILLGDLAV